MNIDVILSPDQDGTIRLSECADTEYVTRIPTGPWDLNFGTHFDDEGKAFSGIVDTSVTLLGGKAGAGKSTLSMQLANTFVQATNVKTNPACKEHPRCNRRDVLYLSAEEGNNQLRARAKRLGITVVNQYHIVLVPLGVKVELANILLGRKPAAVIGDSLSKIAPDMDEAVKFCDRIRAYCEELKMPAILIDHINKDGDFAGFEQLQHSVDCSLMFTIDTDKIRILETLKNRNGEDGVRTYLKMTSKGLVEHIDDDDAGDEEEDDDD
jgi:DNA repair protein RadA/Sms